MLDANIEKTIGAGKTDRAEIKLHVKIPFVTFTPVLVTVFGELAGCRPSARRIT